MEDIQGKKYGKLTVLKLDHNVKTPRVNNGFAITRFWLCKCACGAKEVFQQSDLTGRKAKRCSECTAKEMLRTGKAKGNHGTQIQRCIEKFDSLDRSKLPNFQKYFEHCPLHFQATYGVPYTLENAATEFNKIMNPASARISND